MDKIVFDIETKSFIPDMSDDDLRKLEVSVVGIYSYNDDRYYCFDERELREAGKFFQNARLIIGFTSKRFDAPILAKYFNFNLAAIPHFDIFEEVYKKLGRRISLDALAGANLDVKKTASGADAVKFWNDGEVDKLKEYCRQDVRVTKELYELIINRGYLWVPDRKTNETVKIEIGYKEPEPPPAKLL